MISSLLLSLLVAVQAAPNSPPAPLPPASPSPSTLLAPVRAYAGPNQPLLLNVNTQGPVDLVLVDFIGNTTFGGRTRAPVQGLVDLRAVFADQIKDTGTYLIYATAPGGTVANFVGTPLILQVRADPRRGAPIGPMINKLEPLRYALLTTTAGDLKVCFYYDAAPNTVAAIGRLIEGGFYDGLDFFRVEPNFVLQTGDPRNNGTGGPGFYLDAEFSDRQHLPGVLSISRITDPNEAPGLLPRAEYANSGGSQFFIALNYELAKQLDRRYTAFARVVEGLPTLLALAGTPIEEGKSFRPKSPPRILAAKLVDVTPGDNPYPSLKVVEGAIVSATRQAAIAPLNTPATTAPSQTTITPLP